MLAAPKWRKRSKVRKPISIAKHTSKTAMAAHPSGFPSYNSIQTLQHICLSSSNCSLEVAPPVKKRKVGTAALTEENGDEEEEEEEEAEGDDEAAKGEEEEEEAEAEEPGDAAVSAKKANGAAAPKKVEVETVDLDDEDE